MWLVGSESSKDTVLKYGFIMTTKLIAYVNTSGTSWAPVRKASLGLKEQRTHGALSRPLPFPGPVCFPCTSPGAAQGWVPGSLWSRLPSSRALFLPGWGRTLGLKSHTVSLPLMSSTGSVTLSETTYNKTNFATGWLIQMLKFLQHLINVIVKSVEALNWPAHLAWPFSRAVLSPHRKGSGSLQRNSNILGWWVLNFPAWFQTFSPFM